MHKGIAYGILVAITVLITGCSIFRKNKTGEYHTVTADAGLSTIIENVLENNITEKGFEIRKGSLELEGTEIEGKFGLNATLNSNGDLYASVRGPLGIELIRLLIVENDIAAIDRLNRTVYLGKKDEVLKKRGMPENFMQIVFGDMPVDNEGDYRDNGNNEIIFSSDSGEFRRKISICINEMKICSQVLDATAYDHEIYLTFGNFTQTDGKKYASLITMEDRKKMFHVKLFIDDLSFGYDNEIEFSIPSYKKESF